MSTLFCSNYFEQPWFGDKGGLDSDIDDPELVQTGAFVGNWCHWKQWRELFAHNYSSVD